MLLASAQNTITSRPDIFVPSNFVTDFIRVWWWDLIKALRFLCNGVEQLLDAVYNFLNITTSGIFVDFYDRFRPLIAISFIVSLLVLGTIYLYSEKRPPVLKNFLIGLMVIFAAPTFIQYLNNAIFISKDYLTSELSSTDSIVSANIVDLLFLDQIGWDMAEGNTNSLDEEALNHLDAEEHVNRKNDVSSLGREIFDTKIIVKSDGKIEGSEMGVKGWFDVFDPPYYYRYKIHFFQIAILLIIYIFVLVFASYKAFALIQEILISRILGSLLAMELTSGQKTKKIIEGFFSAYFSLFFILVSFKLYALMQAYINAQSYNGVVRTFLLLFSSFLIMDGPNLVEKILGFDIGLASGGQKFMSLARLGMEGMQLKYYASSLLNGGISNAFSNAANSMNNKSNAFNGMSKGDSPEPSEPPKGNTSYSSPEPNTSPNVSGYNSPSDTDSSGSANNTNNPESNSGKETGFSSSVQEPSFNNGRNSEIAEPNGNQPNTDFSSQDNNNITMPDEKYNKKDGSEVGSRESLNGSNTNIQEPSLNSNSNTGGETSNSMDQSEVSDINTSNQASNAQDSEMMNSSNSPESQSKTTNKATEHNMPSNNTSALNQNSSDQANGQTDIQPSEDKSSGFTKNNQNESTYGTNGDSSSLPTVPEGNSGDTHYNAEDSGATNSTNNNQSALTDQNTSSSETRAQLLDKKFGTESISPNVVSPPPSEESKALPSDEHIEPSSNTPNFTGHDKTSSLQQDGENIADAHNSSSIDSQFGNMKYPTNGPSNAISNGSIPTDTASSASSGNLKPSSDTKPMDNAPSYPNNTTKQASGSSNGDMNHYHDSKLRGNNLHDSNPNDQPNKTKSNGSSSAKTASNTSNGNLKPPADIKPIDNVTANPSNATKASSGLSTGVMNDPLDSKLNGNDLTSSNNSIEPSQNLSPGSTNQPNALKLNNSIVDNSSDIRDNNPDLSSGSSKLSLNPNGVVNSNHRVDGTPDIQLNDNLKITDVLNTPVPEPPKDKKEAENSPKVKRGRKPTKKENQEKPKK